MEECERRSYDATGTAAPWRRATSPPSARSATASSTSSSASLVVECSAVGRLRAAASRAAGWDDDARAVALRPADIVGCAWPGGGAAAAGAALVALYTGAGGEAGRFDVEIGHWPADAPPAEATLQIGRGSYCHGQAHVCEVQMVLEGPDGAELGAQALLLLFHPALS